MTISGNPGQAEELAQNRVVIILPIYRDVEMTRKCIKSALPDVIGSGYAFLLAINDCSPDLGMHQMLREFENSYKNYFKVLTNDINLGFVRTVNSGIKEAGAADFILLNSDVVVAKGWLERFVAVANSDKSIGTITPFSNNATICSFPAFLTECELPSGWTTEEIDTVFSRRELPPVDVPTGVGFCMYIKHACFKDVGFLSYENFTRGYGEENDFCQRAVTFGWRNVVTSNIFAYHKGGVSFTDEKLKLVENAMKTLDRLHPEYHKDVQKFIAQDPLRSHRIQRSIDLLRLTSKKICLAISHELGGGVQQHINELGIFLSGDVHIVTLYPKSSSGKTCLRLFPEYVADELSFAVEDSYANLIELLKMIRVSFVHFHHTHGLHPKLWSIPHDLSLKYAMTAHDFYWIGANPTLTDEMGLFDAEMRVPVVNPLYPLPSGVSEEDWRNNLSSLVNGAAFLIFPSHSTQQLFSKYYKNLNRVAVYHSDSTREVAPPLFLTSRKKIIRIGVIGAISKEKGADLLDAIAALLKRQGVEVILIGYAYRPLVNVTVLGAYDEKLLHFLLEKNKIDMFLFPARWPETFSYTLSYALAHGGPIVAPAVGAFVERLVDRPNVLFFNHRSDAKQISLEILAFIENNGESKTVHLSADVKKARSSQEFYKNEYLSSFAAGENAEIAEPFSATRFEDFVPKRLLLSETILLYAWKIYQIKYIGMIFSIIPFRWKRGFKRFLSKKSIFDIVNASKRH
jgi:GT2 family glycosyltransferase/glycosyltransferase involved in cell wall biosynthesis